MTTFVGFTKGTIWTNFTHTGVSDGNALFFIGLGSHSGSPSVDSVSITGGITPDGQQLVTTGNSVVFFAWWHSVSAGDYAVSVTTTNISQVDGGLQEFSGWTGTATTEDDFNAGQTTVASTSHDAGSVTLSGAGIVLAGARYGAASGDIAWSDLTLLDPFGSRETAAYGIFASGQSVSGAWTSFASITSESAIIAIPEGGGGGSAAKSYYNNFLHSIILGS